MIMRKQCRCVIGIVFIIVMLAACSNNSFNDNTDLVLSDEITETASSEIPNNESMEFAEDSNASADFSKSDEESSFEEDLPRKIVVEIYSEDTQTLIESFELNDKEYCNEVFKEFYKCFDTACDEYPKYHASAADKVIRTKYRISVFLYTYSTDTMTDVSSCIKLCYPYGHNNDVYDITHAELFTDYELCGGKSFIELIDVYVDGYMTN